MAVQFFSGKIWSFPCGFLSATKIPENALIFLKELEQQHLVEYKLKKDQDMLVCHASDFEDV